MNTFIESYLIYKNIGKSEKKGNFDLFFEQLNQLDDELNDSLIFLEVSSAWQYSRFINTQHLLLKLYIPHAAISGHTQGLMLKKGFISKANVHGCFPGWAKGQLYFSNPYFDNFLLASALLPSIAQTFHESA